MVVGEKVMNMDIISKLKYYNKQSLGKKDSNEHNDKEVSMEIGKFHKTADYKTTSHKATERIDIKKKYEIENIIEGHIYNDEEGSCFIIENRYPLSYLYGGCCLGDVLNISCHSLKRLCPDISDNGGNNETLRNFLFLDVETTGLSGGVGTVAFLIGVGFFKDNEFIVRQYFMRDYNEEIAMLNALNLLFQSYEGLVTFNGKAFDWNMIHTRYTFNRIRLAADEVSHIDLLFPSRRIWKGKLESCALSSLEENILEEYRVDDIPGALIPSVYFKYVIDRDAREIKRVVKHNEQDILSMVSLIFKINNMLEDPLSEAECGHELIGLGKMFESTGEYDAVIDCLEKCMKSEDPFVKETALRKLSQIYKRNNEYEKAVRYWKDMISNKEIPSIFSLIELAKYYEHKVKDIPKAIEMTNKALEVSLKLGIDNSVSIHKTNLKADLKKRLDRLMRKEGKNNAWC